ncbi:MAG: ammonium transporter [Dehalococcoidia bacterium]|nr:ammonium transporter [Dehalococcoidia bacterium]
MGVLKRMTVLGLALASVLAVPAIAFAAEPGAGEVNTGDTAWILASSALVMIMTPALGFFYGGMVRHKNALSTIMHSFVIIALISVQWVLWGYSLAFGPDHWGIIGGLDWFGLNGVGLEPNPDYAATIPHQAYMMFQAMFAIITPALITGAFAERIKFKAFLIFTLLWATIVYDPIAHWVWGTGGWIRGLGTLDFAGGTVVHISAGVGALAAALVVGRRMGVKGGVEPHNITMIVLGAGLLWFGWFGFNAGSALTSGGLATSAFVVTNTAAAMAALVWMTMSWAFTGKASVVGTASGAVAGLVAITPASGFVTPMGAIVIGLGAGVFCYLAVRWRASSPLDDSLDVWACHGVGGTWGAIATGLFATLAINSAGANGLFYGNPAQLVSQLIAVVTVWVYSFVLTYVILKVLDMTVGVRVTENEESEGLDLSQHGEVAYNF